MLTYLQRIEWFIGLVLLQVLVLNHMHINGYATPFFFIYFILKIVQEMYARGLEFMPIDIYRANAHEFQIIDGKLMPSLSTIDGLGDKAADAFVTAAAEGPFLSRDDLRQRSKLSKTVIDLMGDLGLLDGLPESNQLSLFDFA